MFSYYSKWIPKFSDKIAPLKNSTSFPISPAAEEAFNNLKLDVEHSVVCTIDESLPFEVETDASDNALSGVLNQGGRPVAFFSKSLQGSELGHPPVEKEACAIIESVRNWKHYLLGKHFTLVTDQTSVNYCGPAINCNGLIMTQLKTSGTFYAHSSSLCAKLDDIQANRKWTAYTE